MIDIPYWIFVWIATVLIHAVIHYGLIGPRRRYGYREEDDLEILTEEVVESVSEDLCWFDESDEGNHSTDGSSPGHRRENISNSSLSSLIAVEQHDMTTSTEQAHIYDPANNTIGGGSSMHEEGGRSPIHVSDFSDDISHSGNNSLMNRWKNPANEYGSNYDTDDPYNHNNCSSACEECDSSRENDEKFRYQLLRDYYSSTYCADDDDDNCWNDDGDENNSSTYPSSQDSLSLRVIPTESQDDIVYENGRIRWSIKRNGGLTNTTRRRHQQQQQPLKVVNRERSNEMDDAMISTRKHKTATNANTNDKKKNNGSVRFVLRDRMRSPILNISPNLVASQ